MAKTVRLADSPAGLQYHPDFLSQDEERVALGEIEKIDFREVSMRGQTARRTVRHYGLDYGYESWQLVATDPFPESLEWIRVRAAELAGVMPQEFAQILVTRYPPGATIGWHRDAPMFGPVVAGVSLLSLCRMRFQRTTADQRQVFEIELEPRSGYLLEGQVRSSWQHSIPPTKSLRYSITFRTLRNPSRWLTEPSPLESAGT